MSAILPADVAVVLTLGPELTVEELTVDSTDVVVVNATMPMVLSYDPVKGDKGDAGASSTVPGPPGPPLTVKGTVANAAALPTTGNQPNDTWITADTGHAWTWTGFPPSWHDLGPFQGPTGPPGATGIAATITVGTTATLVPGTPASVANVGSSSAAVFNFGIPQGTQGAQGIQGAQGTRGSIWWNGSGPPPTPLPGAIPGDYYLDSLTGNYYLLS